jgi:hypothetical protein
MSSFLANALLYPLTAVTTDRFDDEVDAVEAIPADAAKHAIPASVIEKSRKVFVPESDELRTVRWVAGTLSAARAAEVAQTDRLYDLKSGRTYVVDEVTSPRRSIMGSLDAKLDLRLLSEIPLPVAIGGYGLAYGKAYGS